MAKDHREISREANRVQAEEQEEIKAEVEMLFAAVERLTMDAQRKGDHRTHAVLHDVGVALGGLKYKARQALEHLEGEAKELVGKLESL